MGRHPKEKPMLNVYLNLYLVSSELEVEKADRLTLVVSF